MDLNKLLEPYSEDGRTIGGQIKWLMGKGIPQHCIDGAISKIYKEIDLGRKFLNGNELDRALLTEAKDAQNKELEDLLKQRITSIESNLDVEWNKLSKARKIWQVIKGEA